MVNLKASSVFLQVYILAPRAKVPPKYNHTPRIPALSRLIRPNTLHPHQIEYLSIYSKYVFSIFNILNISFRNPALNTNILAIILSGLQSQWFSITELYSAYLVPYSLAARRVLGKANMHFRRRSGVSTSPNSNHCLFSRLSHSDSVSPTRDKSPASFSTARCAWASFSSSIHS